MAKAKEETEDYADIFDATESVEEKVKEVDAKRKGGGSHFWLNEDEEAVVRFLHRKPLVFYQHRASDPDKNDGKGGYTNLTCTKAAGKCPLCEAGVSRSYKGAFLIIHVDAKDFKTKDERPEIKKFVRGINDLRVIDAKNKKFDITERNLEVQRIGSSTDTKYIFDKTDEKAMPKVDWKTIGGKKTDQEDYVDVLKKSFKPDIEKIKDLAEYAESKKSGGKKTKNKDEDVSDDKDDDDDDDDIPF